MKTKKLFGSLIIAAITLTLGLTGCKKQKAFNEENGQSSEDARTAQGENDAAVSDVNDVISNTPNLHGRASGVQNTNGILGNICGLTTDTTGAYTGTIKLNYNGTVCNNRKREGSIRLTVQDYATGKRWKQAGCILKVEYLAYRVTRSSDGKSVELNGVQYITNISGGTWFELIFLNQPTLAHSVTGYDLSVKFDGDKTATYNINRKFTYTFANSIISCTGEGIGSNNGLNNLENYGTTRNGDAFTSEVITPVLWNTTCGAQAPVKGEVNIKVAGKDFTLNCLFGTDASGNSVDVGSNACPYGFKVQWTYKQKTKKKIFGYH
ncbi:MAG: hypothetical protein JWO32_326 [Bacteroidetes bacterium]|nr:hypothetical protein [Bacteroidota bacterium]